VMVWVEGMGSGWASLEIIAIYVLWTWKSHHPSPPVNEILNQ
jgi:hypothetical protein